MMTDTDTALVQSGLGLAVVLGLILVIAWAIRRMRPGRRTPPVSLSLMGQIAVGPKEKVVVVAIDGDWLVLGVAPGRVNLLALGEPATPVDLTPAANDDEGPLGPLDTIERSAVFRKAFGVEKAKAMATAKATATAKAQARP